MRWMPSVYALLLTGLAGHAGVADLASDAPNLVA
jgi:hypothetical protein